MEIGDNTPLHSTPLDQKSLTNEVMRELLKRDGMQWWAYIAETRQRMFHPYGTCPAGNLPIVLGGKGSCHDCESLLLDLFFQRVSKHQFIALAPNTAQSQPQQKQAVG